MSYKGETPDEKVIEGAVVKCNQGEGEIKIKFPSNGLIGVEDNDEKPMLNYYTNKENCFEGKFTKCDKTKDGECVFSVFPFWQNVSTVEYKSGNIELATELNETFTAIKAKIDTLVDEVDVNRNAFFNNSEADQNARFDASFLAFEGLSNYNSTPNDVEQAREFLRLAKKNSESIQNLKQGGWLGLTAKHRDTKTLNDIHLLINEANDILDKINQEKSNINDNPSLGAAIYPLLLKSELPCFKLGYLYFIENGKIEEVVEEKKRESYPPNHRVQNRRHWCYATAALLVAEGTGTLNCQNEIDNYKPLTYQTDTESELMSSFVGYDTDKIYIIVMLLKNML